ncbi:laci bacterial regulatory protein hth signature [Lucifera butyrica]|uniref:Laci bacterial regulatory protein hth signature n=1 Tax=Lucifera butyrica TaxID=1351585 RepID=A0A498RFN5_9FIRM|nr:LacI family DNA-binding transcriptional regulator [Lucifera butyrica]VBB09825.1 laci bacterial regulatory protein hth signature [Lucifera butyrica]
MIKTISDIAKLAGVSKSTVSRHLNGGYVSSEAKEKIETVIARTGYEPNAFAQNLKAKQSNFIGVIVPRLDSYAAARTLIGIDEKLKQHNYQMLIANTGLSREREIESLYSLAKQKVAGIILLATEVSARHQTAIDSIKVPVVLMGQEHSKYYCVTYDDFNAAYELARYVIARGHRKIAYLGVTETDIAVGVRRKAGFRKAAGEAEGLDISYHTTSFAIEDAIDAAARIIRETRPSLLFCATDNIALGAMKSVFSQGLKIPADISVVGFGDYNVSAVVHPGLTTARFDYYQAGFTAAGNLVRLLQGETVQRLIVCDYQIIERESVDKLNF